MVTRPSMRFVPIKEVEHQDIQVWHRVRERLIGAPTALVNEMRGILAEYGIVWPKGGNALVLSMEDVRSYGFRDWHFEYRGYSVS